MEDNGGGYKKWDTGRNHDYGHPYGRNPRDGDKRDPRNHDHGHPYRRRGGDHPSKDSRSNCV